MGNSTSHLEDERERIQGRIADLENALARELENGKRASMTNIAHYYESIRMYERGIKKIDREIKRIEENNGTSKILSWFVKNSEAETSPRNSDEEDYELEESQRIRTILHR
jgi:hypothetical protein